jgi:metallopeptidase MepB
LWINETDLAGVPESDMKSWTVGHDENDGKRFVPFANDGYKTVMARAHKAETRKKMYLAEEAKVPANVEILRDIIIMRDSQARVLGYDNHGSFRIQNRAIKSTEYVKKLLNDLKRSLVPHGRKELQALRQVRYEHRLHMESIASEEPETGDSGFAEDDRFYPWDLDYLKRIHSLRSQIDDAEISQFFPLEHTVLVMLRLFESFLGLKFTQISSDRLDAKWIWHEDVQIWEAWDDEKREFIGFLYIDILWRENKYKGSQNVNIESVREDLMQLSVL